MSKKGLYLVAGGFAILTLFVFFPQSLQVRKAPEILTPITCFDDDECTAEQLKESPLKVPGDNVTSTGPLIYVDLSDCPPKPEYLPEYKAHCWHGNAPASSCSSSEVTKGKNYGSKQMFCVANLQLIGVRKCGTTDFQKWMRHRKDIATLHRDIYMPKMQCPISYFHHCFETGSSAPKNGYFAAGPGNLMLSKKVAQNATHLTLVTPMQFLGYMSTPSTKFFVILREPTERTISYLFHWHREGMIYTDMKHEDITAEFVDGVIREQLTRLKKCIADHGVTYCAYLSDGIDGDMHALLEHSLYVVYIKEALKFIPRDQFLFMTTHEYSKNTTQVLKQITEDFFNLPPQDVILPAAEKKVVNAGIKNPVWTSTQLLLDEFYKPYNKQLADLLGDGKWLFPVSRT